jgi:hypothetical protein
VKPGVSRKVYTGEEALRLLIVGGIEGKPYEAPEVSKLGAPDEFTEGIIEQLEAKGVDVTELREQMQAQLA